MEFTRFKEIINMEIVKKLGDGYRVRLNDVRKNNNIVLTGLTIMRDDSNVSPTIYLNDYYDMYTRGKATIPSVVSDVVDTYHKNRVDRSVDMRFFLNYESVRPRIVYKLVNTERNQKLLEDVPHTEYLDLSVIFQCLVSQKGLGMASIQIHNVHMKLWDVTVEELFQAAVENTPKLLPYELKSMTEVLAEIMQSESPEDYDYEECVQQFSDSVPMYVLSNGSRVEGAACMMYPDLIADFADAVGSSLYVIPSSVHEVLLLPTGNDSETAEIKCMIREINDKQVSAEEILSYSLYFYDREAGKTVIL